MSTEIKIDGYAENGEKPWIPREAGGAGIPSGPNPKHRAANVEIKIYWGEDHNDLAQARTALDALDQVYETTRSHLDALRAIAEESEERKAAREREDAEIREAKKIVGEVAEKFLAEEGDF